MITGRKLAFLSRVRACFFQEEIDKRLDAIVRSILIWSKMNNPAASSGVSKGTCAPRGGELDPHLSRSALPRG